MKVILMGGKHMVRDKTTGEDKVYRVGDELDVSEATQKQDPKRFQPVGMIMPTPSAGADDAAAKVIVAAEDQAAAIVAKAEEEASTIVAAAANAPTDPATPAGESQ